MLKSLFSGISGLQAHQVAMDVESNNIANVNTTGYKYSRANFSDLLSQNKTIATAPQGNLGGKNPVQIGLGSAAQSTSRIFSQGSVQATDNSMDTMIQGDGFFIISPDDGQTYKYTRSGGFKFDALGSLVDNTGYTVQGWLRDKDTKIVDPSKPIEDIVIEPGLVTPALATKNLTIKGNLSAGSTVKSFSPAYEIASTPPPNDASVPTISPAPKAKDSEGNIVNSGNVGVMVDPEGEGFSLQEKQGVWASFRSSVVDIGIPKPIAAADPKETIELTFTVDTELDIKGDEVVIKSTSKGTRTERADELVSAINDKTDIHGVTASRNSIGQITLTNNNDSDSTSHNISVVVNSTDDGIGGGQDKVAYRYQYNPKAAKITAGADKEFKTIADLREALELQARNVGDADTPKDTTVTATDPTADETIYLKIDGVGIKVDEKDADDAAATAKKYVDAINLADIQGVTAVVDPADATRYIITNKNPQDLVVNTRNADGYDDGNSGLPATIDKADGDGTADENNISITLNKEGQLEVKNIDGGEDGSYDMNLKITNYTNKNKGSKVSNNIRFSKNMNALNSALTKGSDSKALSKAFSVPTHASTINVFDSVGAKHTVITEFRKISVDKTKGSSWGITVSVPEPATINTSEPKNKKTGIIRFDNEGVYLTSTLTSIALSGNNGSAPDQQISFNFGTPGLTDGMKSFDINSSTTEIRQDGYTSGGLVGITIDGAGNLVGSFSNNQSFALAQIATAKFVNNEGLSVEGSNNYIQTGNSGEPIIGIAGNSGRGSIKSSALEGSNVDLSRSLTQLIIIQRGFQANGKTITTSDQMLQTLIGLKQ
jgi:flagellar hook protein FlgE